MASMQEALAREFQQYGGSVSGKGTAGGDFKNPSFADGWNKKKEADDLVKKASGGFSLFGGKEDKYMQAQDLFGKAAASFRGAQAHAHSAQASLAKASLERDLLKDDIDAPRSWLEAAQRLMQAGCLADAARVQEQAIAAYKGEGKFRQAAGYQVTLANEMVNPADKKRKADLLVEAADWYAGDNAKAMANKQLEAAAGLYAQMEEYGRAVGYYEQIAQDALRNDTMKFSAKKWLFKAEIILLVQGDTVAIDRALQTHLSMLPSYQGDGEYHLIKDLVELTSDPGATADDFGARLEQHNRLYRLDDWDVEMFLRIRKRLEGEGEDFS